MITSDVRLLAKSSASQPALHYIDVFQSKVAPSDSHRHHERPQVRHGTRWRLVWVDRLMILRRAAVVDTMAESQVIKMDETEERETARSARTHGADLRETAREIRQILGPGGSGARAAVW